MLLRVCVNNVVITGAAAVSYLLGEKRKKNRYTRSRCKNNVAVALQLPQPQPQFLFIFVGFFDEIMRVPSLTLR